MFLTVLAIVKFQGWNNNHNNHDRNYNSSHLIGSSIGSSMIPIANDLEPEGNLDHKDDLIVELTEGLPSNQDQLYMLITPWEIKVIAR